MKDWNWVLPLVFVVALLVYALAVIGFGKVTGWY